MPYKCPFCLRTFGNKSAYSQHVNCCQPLVTSEEESSFVTDVSNMSLDNEKEIYVDETSNENEIDYKEVSTYDQESNQSSSNYEDDQNSFLGNQSFCDQSFSNYEGDQSFSSYDGDQSFESILEEPKPEVNAEYPNKAYADLMTLVTKYNLSNAAGNAVIKFFNKYSNLSESPLPKSIEKGRKHMDNMNLPNFKFDKTRVITYNDNGYDLYHRSLINCIKNILSISDISKNFALKSENLKYEGERAYGEQNTGIWWENTEKSLPPGSHLLSIMLYSDASNVDALGKTQLHPIFMTIGNIKSWRRNKQDAKQLLGYLPILKCNNATEKKNEKFKSAARTAFHNSLRVLLNPILKLKSGIDLILNGEKYWFFPRISVVISDWPEAATFCLTYKSSLSNFPCHFCLVSKENLANVDLQTDEIQLRTHNDMRNYLNNNLQKSVCIENLSNFFWELPDINIYTATVADRMHHLDLGLFSYQIEFTRQLIKAQNDNTLVDEMDRRLAAIPRYPGLKIFKNGLQSISRLTANEYRNLMKVMIFVIDNLYEKNTKNIENFINNERLASLYEKWNEMYTISRYEIFKESDLDKFKESINEWSQEFVEIFKNFSEFKFPKLHSWIYHIVESIKSFGAINGYTTETYESLHKDYVKTPYRLSNKKDVEIQIMKIVRRQSIARMSSQNQSAVTPCALKFTARIFEFSFVNTRIFFAEKNSQSNIDDKMKTGFSKFLKCLKLYQEQFGISIADDDNVTIYGSVTLGNGAIMRATNRFHGRSWFSDISVHMHSDELFSYTTDQGGICYGQALLILTINIKKRNAPLNLALIQWYDFTAKNQYIYCCPRLNLIKSFNLIDIEAIKDIEHIIPRFNLDNEYLVNKFK